jgi:hypothetical protein
MTELRKVDIGDTAVLPPEDVRAGAVPEMRWLEIDDLRIDDSFQRPLARANWTAIRKIAAGFSWSMFTPVVVAPIVGGQYSLIDGQHRTHAAKICGFDRVPAMIVMTAEVGQAAAFAAINGNVVRMSTFHIFKAALAAKVDWAVRADAAVAAAGCWLMTYNPGSGVRPRYVMCIQEIRRHIEAGRDRVVIDGLEALGHSFAPGVQHYAQNVVGPWLSVLAELGPAARGADLAAFCRKNDLAHLRDKCQSLAQADEFRGRKPIEIFRTALMAMAKRELCEKAPVPQLAGEDALAARMVEVAARDRKAMRAII